MYQILGRSRRHYESALAIHREVGNRLEEGFVLGYLGSLDQEQGRLQEARAQFESAHAILCEIDNPRGEGSILASIGRLELEEGRMPLRRRGD